MIDQHPLRAFVVVYIRNPFLLDPDLRIYIMADNDVSRSGKSDSTNSEERTDLEATSPGWRRNLHGSLVIEKTFKMDGEYKQQQTRTKDAGQ